MEVHLCRDLASLRNQSMNLWHLYVLELLPFMCFWSPSSISWFHLVMIPWKNPRVPVMAMLCRSCWAVKVKWMEFPLNTLSLVVPSSLYCWSCLSSLVVVVVRSHRACFDYISCLSSDVVFSLFAFNTKTYRIVFFMKPMHDSCELIDRRECERQEETIFFHSKFHNADRFSREKWHQKNVMIESMMVLSWIERHSHRIHQSIEEIQE